MSRENDRNAYIFIGFGRTFGGQLVSHKICVVATADVVVTDRPCEVLLCRVGVFDGFEPITVIDSF
jgi:hypothetical protein